MTTAAEDRQDAAVDARPAARLRGSDLLYRYALVAVWIGLIALFGVLRPETFFTASNFQTIFSSQAVLLVLTLALLVPLSAGEFDLSVAGILGLSLVLVGWLDVTHGWPILLAIGVALLAGAGVGLVNSFFIVVVGVESIIVTLGMGTLLTGVAIGINNATVSGVSPAFVDVVRAEFLGVQMAFWFALALTVICWYVYSYTPLGRYLYFVGAGREVAQLSGLRVDALRIGSLVFSGVVSALSGVLLAGILGAADPNVGQTYLLPAFAAVFLGATAIKPGRFNPWGSFVAVYFLVTGITGLQLLGLVGWIEQFFYGTSLVLAVTFSHLAGRRRNAT